MDMKETQGNCMEAKIIPVILAGGTGSRLWPVSRESFPKQFCSLFNEQSLLQNTIARAKHITEGDDLIVITNENHYFLCKDQLDHLDIGRIHYILEPCARNTAPAIALAAAYAQQYIHSEATLLVMPSDHHLEDHAGFKNMLDQAAPLSAQGKCVTFGVVPTSPKTGYGYIEQGDSLCEGGYKVKRFVEKPSLSVAKSYVASGDFYWNSGMFLFKAETYLNELALHSNDIYLKSLEAFKLGKKQSDFCRVDRSLNECRSASIDYEVMEKTQNAVMIPLDLAWSDLGCWSSLSEIGDSDVNGNVLQGNVIARETANCLISSVEKKVVTIGLQDQIVINTQDAVLVADKAYSQDVKKVVEQMKLVQDPVATEHQRVYRPWGYYEKLSFGPGYQVKHLMIKPGGSMSLQLHHHRSEHWVVVSGQAEVLIDGKVLTLVANQSAYVEKEMKHRLSNKTKEPVSVIEVQNGQYLGEDDIVRFEDVYSDVLGSRQPEFEN